MQRSTLAVPPLSQRQRLNLPQRNLQQRIDKKKGELERAADMLRLSVNGSVITRGAAHPTTQMDAERLRGVLEFLDRSAGPEGRPEIQQELDAQFAALEAMQSQADAAKASEVPF